MKTARLFVIYRLVLLRTKNVSVKICRRNQNTHFMFNNFFFSFKSRDVYEIMWKNIVGRGRPQIKIWRMLIECWITKATNTHSQYVILIILPLQQWLHQRPSVLGYTYSTFPLLFVVVLVPSRQLPCQYFGLVTAPDLFLLQHHISKFSR